ncbi:MAG: hypothetical protein GY724_05935 [Actinomycetia bacterium]|nr:hypothetical protein [Actinomycetes bacterium]
MTTSSNETLVGGGTVDGQHGSRTEIERAVGLVRLVLAMACCSVVIGARASQTNYGRATLLVAFIAATTAGIHGLTLWLGGRHFWGWPAGMMLQGAESAAAIGLVIVIGDVAPDAGWVMLAIPIIVSSLRLGVAGVFTTWAFTSAGYLAALWIDAVPPGRSAIDSSLVFERPGALLGVASAVAVLTRWLQDSWARQADLTLESERRLGYALVVERGGRAMRRAERAEIMSACLHHLVDLGFLAATTADADGGTEVEVVGDHLIVPANHGPLIPDPGTIEVTKWQDRLGRRVYSAAVMEPRSRRIVTGWSNDEPPRAALEGVIDLIGMASTSIELADLLGAARREAEHGPLTGMAN